VAVKRLRRRNAEAFENESAILRGLLRTPHVHPHLITLLATFEQREQHYLILPWADMDLESYWIFTNQKKNERHSNWLVRQCQGIAEALSQIHRYVTTSGTTINYPKPNTLSKVKIFQEKSQGHDPAKQRKSLTLSGRHGDIKPKNILWYSDPAGTQGLGTLKLSDFGSARFREKSKTHVVDEDEVSMAASGTYLSPECRMPDAKSGIQCDVWALGCVFLEFVCWYHFGWPGLRAFERQRNLGYASDSFFDILRVSKTEGSPQCYAVVKETVIEVSTSLAAIMGARLTGTSKKIAELRELSKRSKSYKGLNELLDSIENNMLVVQNGVLNTVQGSENSTAHRLKVQQTEHHRRLSSGNIARNLGGTLDLLEPSGRESSDSA
jgi:serine/threonine protein kinase